MNCRHCCIACGVISFDSVTTVMGCCIPFAFSVCKKLISQRWLRTKRWSRARIFTLTRHIRIFWKAGWFNSLDAPLVFLWLSIVGSTWKLDRRLSCSQTLQKRVPVCEMRYRWSIQTLYLQNIANSALLRNWKVPTLKDRAKAKGTAFNSLFGNNSFKLRCVGWCKSGSTVHLSVSITKHTQTC